MSEAEVVLAVYRRGLMLVPQDAERNILITSILGSFVDRAREGGQPAIECLQRKGRDRFGIVDALRRELGALGELEPKYILRNPPDFTVGEFIPSRIAGNRRRCGADDSVLRVQFVPDVTPDGKLAHVDLNKIRATIVGGSSGFRLANRLESFAIAYAYARDPDLFGQERGRPFHFWMDSGTYGVGLFRIIPRRGASMSFEVVDYSRPNIGDRGAVFWFPK